ncbi:STAS domain-containing protein [Dactylosporangium sp. McL0621]|uniref:STAS domain-containing protein n=1 Tax=Dactylosporangium sp. McL0621 TaxID=3415678 RepID=UPI003CEC357E
MRWIWRPRPALRAYLQQAMDEGASVIVLNLAGVGFIDSSGLGAVLSGYKELRQRTGRLCLAAVQPIVRRVFELTSVDRLVTIYDSVEAAEADPGVGRER